MSLESPALAGGFFTAEPRGEPSGHKVWRWSQQSPHPLEAQKCKFPGPRESEALEVGPVICGFLKYLFNWLFGCPSLSCRTQDLQLQHVGTGSLTRDGTRVPCTGNVES